jgi:hypothetical protein
MFDDIGSADCRIYGGMGGTTESCRYACAGTTSRCRKPMGFHPLLRRLMLGYRTVLSNTSTRPDFVSITITAGSETIGAREFKANGKLPIRSPTRAEAGIQFVLHYRMRRSSLLLKKQVTRLLLVARAPTSSSTIMLSMQMCCQ